MNLGSPSGPAATLFFFISLSLSSPLWGEERPAQAVHVAQAHLDAGVGEAELVEAAGVAPGADVALARERRDADGVLLPRLGQVITDAPIHVSLQGEGEKDV